MHPGISDYARHKANKRPVSTEVVADITFNYLIKTYLSQGR